MNDLTRKILQALLEGEVIEVMFQDWNPEGWRQVLRALADANDITHYDIRIKPKTLKPETPEPLLNSYYYVPKTPLVGASKLIWEGDEIDLWFLENGRVFLKKEDALESSRILNEEGKSMRKTIPYDYSRCKGVFANDEVCSKRESCQRYLAYSDWDKEAGIPPYQPIPYILVEQAPCDSYVKDSN